MKIPFLIESENGHDTKLVDEEKVADEVEKQLKDGKWVTVEKKDGTTEMLTGLPEKKTEEVKSNAEVKDWKNTFSKTEEKKESDASWKNSFVGAKSVTTTNKMKGG